MFKTISFDYEDNLTNRKIYKLQICASSYTLYTWYTLPTGKYNFNNLYKAEWLAPFSKLSCYFILQTIVSLTCSHDYYFKDTYYDSLLPVSKNAIGMAGLFVCLLAVKVPSSSDGF